MRQLQKMLPFSRSDGFPSSQPMRCVDIYAAGKGQHRSHRKGLIAGGGFCALLVRKVLFFNGKCSVKHPLKHAGRILPQHNTQYMRYRELSGCDVLGGPFSYVGFVRECDGRRHGMGIITYESGHVYSGEWIDGMRDGRGRYCWPDGRVYEGEYQDDERNGRGRMLQMTRCLSDSRMRAVEWYDGEWKDGKANGTGKHTWPDGDVFEGEFKDDHISGRGRLTSTNGEVYEGEYRASKKSGRGKFTWRDGAVYEGEFEADKRNGRGKMTWAGGSVYEGEWRDGRCHGQGTKYRKYRFLCRQSGSWWRGRFVGEKNLPDDDDKRFFLSW